MTLTTLSDLHDIHGLIVRINRVDFGEEGKEPLAAFNAEMMDLLDVALRSDDVKTQNQVTIHSLTRLAWPDAGRNEREESNDQTNR